MLAGVALGVLGVLLSQARFAVREQRGEKKRALVREVAAPV